MDIERDHEYIVEAVPQAARDVLGNMEKQGKVSQWWWSDDLTDTVEERRKACNRWLNRRTTENRHEYNRNKAPVKNNVKKQRTTSGIIDARRLTMKNANSSWPGGRAIKFTKYEGIYLTERITNLINKCVACKKNS